MKTKYKDKSYFDPKWSSIKLLTARFILKDHTTPYSTLSSPKICELKYFSSEGAQD